MLNLCQPVVLLLLFSQVFGAIANPELLPPGTAYVDYLLPALLVTTVMGPATNSGVGLVRDMTGGFLTRLRSMPVDPCWILLARSVSDVARVVAQLIVLVIAGVVLFGFVPAGGPLGMLAALAVAVLVAWTLTWIFLALGSWLRDVEMMQSIGVISVFPLMFASSAFVPVHAFPGWLQVVAMANPMSHAMRATRELALGWSTGHTLPAVATCVGFLALGMFCAVRGFRRPIVG
ncbi:ABC-2 type transport system permease protein [Prauserella shujinwangii]|uniref:Transport permease protein n=1 Tax=Prauserella shujinwangii TaxID=1453103 RepID=A0A2T0M3R8_9PSEU|nr:ABC-2 type transport system permease protein [Prauserella shujinwangii]